MSPKVSWPVTRDKSNAWSTEESDVTVTATYADTAVASTSCVVGKALKIWELDQFHHIGRLRNLLHRRYNLPLRP